MFTVDILHAEVSSLSCHMRLQVRKLYNLLKGLSLWEFKANYWFSWQKEVSELLLWFCIGVFLWFKSFAIIQPWGCFNNTNIKVSLMKLAFFIWHKNFIQTFYYFEMWVICLKTAEVTKMKLVYSYKWFCNFKRCGSRSHCVVIKCLNFIFTLHGASKKFNTTASSNLISVYKMAGK